MTTYKWPLMGHIRQLKALESDLAQDRISQAYLFSGPSQIGKTLIAKTFAQILQCNKGFCRDCPTCRQIDHEQHIDTFFLKDDGESLKIETIRNLVHHLSTTTSSNYKVVIIQNIERITIAAANAFLKTLEEPISRVVFLLTTTQKQKLLDTILSRTRVLNFQTIPEAELHDYLKKDYPTLDKNTATMMATFAMGRPGRVMEFAKDPDRFRYYQDMYHQIAKFLERSSVTDRMLYVDDLLKMPDSIDPFFELFSHLVRGLMLQKLAGDQVMYSFEQLFGIVDYLSQARFELDHNVNSKLVLENLMLRF